MKITPQFFNQIQNCLITDPELYTVKKTHCCNSTITATKKKKKSNYKKEKLFN